MRIWDISVYRLCRQHLLAEHRELHAVWAVLTKGKKGYSRHPETIRWRGRLHALRRRHEQQVVAMGNYGWPSGYEHRTELKVHGGLVNAYLAGFRRPARRYAVNTLAEQVANLRGKGCGCNLEGLTG